MAGSRKEQAISFEINGRESLYKLLHQQMLFLADESTKRQREYLLYEVEAQDPLFDSPRDALWRSMQTRGMEFEVQNDPLLTEVDLYVFSDL